jgi:hypothetical protein
LRFEQLEDRSLLAVASFAFNLYHDDGGSPGLPLEDDTLEVGQEFFVQIVAREHHPGFSGLGAVFLDIAWDADVLDVVEPFDPRDAVTPNLPLFVGGRLLQQDTNIRPFVVDSQIRQNVGTIDGLGGLAFEASGVGRPIGSDGDDRFVKPQFLGYSTTDDHFAWLHFRAERAGEALLTMRQGGLRIAPLPVASLSSRHLHFEPQIVTVVEPMGSAEYPLIEETTVDASANDVWNVLDEPSSVVETPVSSVPDVPIHNTPELPGQVESVFERALEPQIETPPPTSVIVESPPIEEPVPASEEPPSSSPAVWHNAGYPLDVDGTGRVAPLDVLIIANHLNVNFGNWELPPLQFTPPRYLDVNGDGRATPHDALLVVNYIELQRNPEAEGEAEPFYPSEFLETTPVSETSDHVDATLRDAAFTPRTPRSALREGVSHRASRPVSARPDHVDAALQDAARIAGFGRNAEPEPQEALARGRSAADPALRARRVFLASWSEIEDILPILTADWLRNA